MPNYIVYYAASSDEILECAYSLLKYLDVYNLKPPPDHAVVIHTHKPALLEAYSSFFHQFDLVEVPASEEKGTEGRLEKISLFAREHKGNVLYFGGATYPVRELGMLFSNISKGTIYGSLPKKIRPGGEDSPAPILLGFNGQAHSSIGRVLKTENITEPRGIIEEYADLKEFRDFLRQFFSKNGEESIPNQVKLIHHINAKQIQDQKKLFQQLPLYVRLMRRLSGRGWKISDHARNQE